MKTMKYLCLAALVAFSLVIPAAAQKGAHNNNGAGKLNGQARAEAVQTANNKGDKDHTPFKGSKRKSQGKKTRTREGWEKNANHKGSSK